MGDAGIKKTARASSTSSSEYRTLRQIRDMKFTVTNAEYVNNVTTPGPYTSIIDKSVTL